MKRVIRSGERLGFLAASCHVARTVADMFDRLITWFTPERRARFIFPAEIALGAFFLLALLLDQAWRGGFAAGVMTFVVAVLLSLGVTVYRVRPAIALASLLASSPIGALATVSYGPPVNGFIYVAVMIVIFGGAAFGSSVVRWVALGFSSLGALTVVLLGIASSGVFYGVDLAFAVSQGIYLLMISALVFVPWVLGELVRSIRNRRQLSATVATVSTQRDAALTRADLEAERTRVARDVHDIVAHSLTVVIAQADGARYATAGDSPAAADAFETIAQTARDALADVRVLLTELRHTQEAGPQPGLDDLDALLQSMRDSGLSLEVREFGDRGRLTESRELALYRIVQESLTNALRHGDGAATLELEWGEQAVDLVVTNTAAAGHDGSDTRESTERGHGIDGMRERASLAGGELSVHEGPVFRVRARLPLEQRPDAPTDAQPETAGREPAMPTGERAAAEVLA